MAETNTVMYSCTDGVALITLNRPETLNAWNAQFGSELLGAIEQAGEDASARVVCITGAGRAFSSGADLADVTTADLKQNDRPDLGKVLGERYNPIILAIRRLEKPVVAAVNGPAVGIGMSLALAADLVVAKRSAYLLLAFANIGLAPDGGASLIVPARIGITRATELAMLGGRIGAEQAEQWGLINTAWDDEDFEGELQALLARLAGGATLAYAAIKRQINQQLLPALEDQLSAEAEIQNELADSDDFVAGASAFLMKKKPEFKGC